MLRPFVKVVISLSCILLFVYCSKEPELDFSAGFACATPTPLEVCSKPDSLGTFGNEDCDGGGITNYDECIAGTDFYDIEDDCTAAIRAKVDICKIISEDPSSILRDWDCDGGGISNYEECLKGFDPLKDNDIDELNRTIDDGEIKLYLKDKFSSLDTTGITDTIGIVGFITQNNDQDTFQVNRTSSGIISVIPLGSIGDTLDSEDIVVFNYSTSYLTYQPDTTASLSSQIENIALNDVDHENNIDKTSKVKDLIKGLQEGLNHIKVGTQGTLIIPSGLAYNQLPFEGIPSYSVLIFDIDFKEIQ